ncbi:MAG: D-aminoacyl-tRNA deacylase [Promethearchaeia archaeon]
MVNFLIITSTEDIASMNIREHLLNFNFINSIESELKWYNNSVIEIKGFVDNREINKFFNENKIYIGLIDKPLIHLDNLLLKESGLEIDFLVFASRHRSEAARPAFLAHSTGNWSDSADFGGNAKELSKTSALLQKAAFDSLLAAYNSSHLEGFSVDIEVTHHGPTTLEKPLVFVELGSSESEWSIKPAGKVVAEAVLNTCINYLNLNEKKSIKICLGFGGTHYAPQFRKLLIKDNIAFSFICPKYFIKDLNEDLIKQMIDNTLEKIEYFVIDWKGTNSADKQHLIPLLEQFNIPIKRTKEL